MKTAVSNFNVKRGDFIPKFKIISELYFFESLMAIGFLAVCTFIGIVIGKGWYKAVIEIFKTSKE